MRIFYIYLAAVSHGQFKRRGQKVKQKKNMERPVAARPRFFGDDIFYGDSTLEEYRAAGMDTSQLRRATTNPHGRGLQARVLKCLPCFFDQNFAQKSRLSQWKI